MVRFARGGVSRIRGCWVCSLYPQRRMEQIGFGPSRRSWPYIRYCDLHSEPDSASLLVFHGCLTANRRRTFLCRCRSTNLGASGSAAKYGCDTVRPGKTDYWGSSCGYDPLGHLTLTPRPVKLSEFGQTSSHVIQVGLKP